MKWAGVGEGDLARIIIFSGAAGLALLSFRAIRLVGVGLAVVVTRIRERSRAA
jgi:hypothetical protein